VIMYEMLVGSPPFYAHDSMTTCRRILNWRTTLEFPVEAKLEASAIDLLKKLLCGVGERLTEHQIKVPSTHTSPQHITLRYLPSTH